MVKVLSNFSQERLAHIREVVRYLRPMSDSIKVTSKKNFNSKHEHNESGFCRESKRRAQAHGNYLGARKRNYTLGGAIIVGGILCSTGASVVGVLGGIATGAVVGAVVSSLVDTER